MENNSINTKTKGKIEVIEKNSVAYPKNLDVLYKAPKRLYYIGEPKILEERAIAIVGSRKCSEYGKQVALKIGKEAARHNLVTISGMAKGIDYYAMMGALKENGKVIGVLGCGPDVCYPRENIRLYDEITKKGLILSEYPPKTEPKPYRFPERNRIIAALSEAIVVVEAASKSGAIITAEIGAELGKEVFSVPGNITSSYSLGTNKLIFDGAKPVAVIQDIFYQLGIKSPNVDDKELNLGKDEMEIYKIIKANGEISIEEICFKTEKKPYEVTAIVSILEMKGLISYSLGKIFVANL